MPYWNRLTSRVCLCSWFLSADGINNNLQTFNTFVVIVFEEKNKKKNNTTSNTVKTHFKASQEKICSVLNKILTTTPTNLYSLLSIDNFNFFREKKKLHNRKRLTTYLLGTCIWSCIGYKWIDLKAFESHWKHQQQNTHKHS